MNLDRVIRVAIKLLLSFVLLFIFGSAMAIMDAANAGPLFHILVLVGTVGALRAIYKYEPNPKSTELDKSP